MTSWLAGKHILIVEDECLLAIDLADAVAGQGGEVVGPCATVERALTAIANVRVDGAILDVGLRDSDCYPVADALARRRVPFVFATGYEDLPERFASVPYFRKPSPASQVARALADAISRASSTT